MAEGARLESVYTFARIEGSNPSLTATLLKALIAQLDRALGYELRGREFESLWAHQLKQ